MFLIMDVGIERRGSTHTFRPSSGIINPRPVSFPSCLPPALPLQALLNFVSSCSWIATVSAYYSLLRFLWWSTPNITFTVSDIYYVPTALWRSPMSSSRTFMALKGSPVSMKQPARIAVFPSWVPGRLAPPSWMRRWGPFEVTSQQGNTLLPCATQSY